MIEFSHVSKLFGAQKAVNDLNLNFQEGSFSVLIGTSGSGKSTTLKMINRLVEHDSGVIRFAGEEIRSLPPMVHYSPPYRHCWFTTRATRSPGVSSAITNRFVILATLPDH